MNIESLLPFAIIIAILLFAFVLEAVVMYAFGLKRFWPSLGLSVLLNFVSFLMIYFLARPFLSVFQYDIGKPSGLNLQPQVIAFLWWFSVVAEGFLLSLFLPRQPKRRIYVSAMLMNLLSFVFLYVFDIISH